MLCYMALFPIIKGLLQNFKWIESLVALYEKHFAIIVQSK